MQRVWMLVIWLLAAVAAAQPDVALPDALAELGPPAEILVVSQTGVIVAVGGLDHEAGFWLELVPGASGAAIMIVSRPDGSSLHDFDVVLEGGRVLTSEGEDLAATLREKGVDAVRIHVAERTDDAGPPPGRPDVGGAPAPEVPPVSGPGQGAGGDAPGGIDAPVGPPATPGGGGEDAPADGGEGNGPGDGDAGADQGDDPDDDPNDEPDDGDLPLDPPAPPGAALQAPPPAAAP